MKKSNYGIIVRLIALLTATVMILLAFTACANGNNGKDDQHLLPYFDRSDWKDFGRAWRDIGFDGVFSLELGPPYHLPNRAYDLLIQSICVSLEELLGQKVLRF